MTLFDKSFPVGLATAALVLGLAGGRAVADTAADVALAPHRAIYDLKLAEARGKRSLEAVRGRIVYDFSGSACEGYALQFRQVTELDSGEGKAAVSDLRSITWEDGAAKTFRFNSQNYIDSRLIDSVDGIAERRPDGGVGVTLTKPQEKKAELGPVAYPSDHMRRIIAAARAGQTLIELAVFDGSETGEKIYQSLTVIGRKIAPDERKPTDAAANAPALAGMARWPVTISYFDNSKHDGEQTPVYSISFEAYDNGIARVLVLDYGDFAVTGEMTSLEVKEAKACQ